MKNNQFRMPLFQSGALLLGIIFIIAMMPSGDHMSVGGVIGSFITGFFQLVLFALSLLISVAVCIAVLIGIFISAVALYSPEQASSIYSATKERFSSVLLCKDQSCCADSVVISEQEYKSMKSEIASLKKKVKDLS